MNLVPFDKPGTNLPAYLSDPTALGDINKDVVRAAQFPTMSIKGKVFTLNKDGVKKMLTKPDDPDEVAQSIGVVILRANMAAKVFYLKKFDNDNSDGAPPDCYSYDTITPSQHAPNPQSKKCATCPHHVWGSRVNDGDRPGEEKKGRACSDTGRLAIAAPDKLEDAMLMRVPPASLRNLRDAVKVINQRKVPYNAVIMKISFDPEQASPCLKFKPIAFLEEADYAKVKNEVYDGELVRGICGLDDIQDVAPTADAPGPVSTDELDAAIAARAATQKARETAPAPAAATPAATPAPAPVAAKTAARKAPKVDPDELAAAVASPAPAADGGVGSLLSDIDSLLGSSDD